MQFTAKQIAELTGGSVEGNENVAVWTVAKIEQGHPGAISFLANPKYTPYIYTTESSIVIVRNDFIAEQPITATLIRVDDPYATIAHLLQMVAELTEPKYSGVEQPCHIAEGVEVSADCYIGAFAYISDGVKLGKNVQIHPRAYIGKNVTVGDNTIIKPGATIYHNCVIGNNVTIHAGVVIGGDGFGFAPTDGHYDKIPQIGNVVIEDNVEIGANTTIDRATMGSTVIKKGVKLDNLIQVAHNVEIGENTVMAAQVGVAGSTKIGCNNMVGGQVGFAGHITIGDNNAIGAQSGIPNSVGSGHRLMGYPAVEASQFARNTVYIKKLAEMAQKIEQLQSELKSIKTQS